MSKKGEKLKIYESENLRATWEVEMKKSLPIYKRRKASDSLKLSRKSTTSTLINETQC